MCLCGMLAAEFQTLPEPMRAIVLGFFNDQETWLSRVLEQGRREGTLHFTGSTGEAARLVVAALEGAMLVARPYGDVSRFHDAATALIAGLRSDSQAER
jgi:TetR/AcrR family transcriptional repressor of nem operon